MNIKDMSTINDGKNKNKKKAQVPQTNEQSQEQPTFFRKIMMYQKYFKEFFDECPADVQKEYNEKFKMIETTKGFIPINAFKQLQGHKGLYEIRISTKDNIYRTFTTFDKGNIIVLYNSIIKKTQKTPKQALENAERLRKEYGGDQSKLTQFIVKDSLEDNLENDAAIEIAEQLYQDFKNGKGKVYDIDFMDIENAQKVKDSQWRTGFPRGCGLYAETRCYYQDDQMIDCDVFVQFGYKSDVENETITETKNGITTITQTAEFFTRYEEEMDNWIDEFVFQIKKEYGVNCNVEYWY